MAWRFCVASTRRQVLTVGQENHGQGFSSDDQEEKTRVSLGVKQLGDDHMDRFVSPSYPQRHRLSVKSPT